jgi:hypothetical protein
MHRVGHRYNFHNSLARFRQSLPFCCVRRDGRNLIRWVLRVKRPTLRALRFISVVFRFCATELDLRRFRVEGHGFFFDRKLRPRSRIRKATKHRGGTPDKFRPRGVCLASFDYDADENRYERRCYV